MLSTILLVIAIVLFVIAAVAPTALSGGVTGRIHFGWLGLAFLAGAHLVPLL